MTTPPSVAARVLAAPPDRRGPECPAVFYHIFNLDPAVVCDRNCARFFAATVHASLLYAVAGCRRGKGKAVEDGTTRSAIEASGRSADAGGEVDVVAPAPRVKGRRGSCISERKRGGKLRCCPGWYNNNPLSIAS